MCENEKIMYNHREREVNLTILLKFRFQYLIFMNIFSS